MQNLSVFLLFVATLLLQPYLPGRKHGHCTIPIQQSPDELEGMIDENERKALDERQHIERLRRNTHLFRLLELGLKHPEIGRTLRLTDGQRMKVASITDELRLRKAELVEQLKGLPNIDSLIQGRTILFREELKDRLFNALDIEQLEELSRMNFVEAGLPHVLTDSNIGDFLELSKEQAAKLKADCNGLAKKVEKLIHNTRQEAHDAIYSNLTEEQISRLNEIYGSKKLDNYSRHIAFRTIYAHFHYPNDGNRDFPMSSVHETKINK